MILAEFGGIAKENAALGLAHENLPQSGFLGAGIGDQAGFPVQSLGGKKAKIGGNHFCIFFGEIASSNGGMQLI